MLPIIVIMMGIAGVIYTIDPSERKRLIFLSAAILFVGVLAAVVHQLSLLGSGNDEYGSDAHFYWLDVKLYINGEQDQFRDRYAALFKWFSVGIQRTIPFESILMTRIGNVLLLVLTLQFIYKSMRLLGVDAKYSLLTIGMIGFNGVVLWTTIRHLKEPLYWVLLISFIYAIQYSITRFRSRFWIQWAALGIAAVVFHTFVEHIRVWGYFLAWGIPSITWAVSGGLPRPVWLKAILLSVILVIPIHAVVNLSTGLTIEERSDYQEVIVAATAAATDELSPTPISSATASPEPLATASPVTPEPTPPSIRNRSYLSAASNRDIGSLGGLLKTVVSPEFVLSIGRFLTGPGPVLAVIGHQRFVHTTTFGNVLIFAGTLFWWIAFPVMVALAVIYRPSQVVHKLSYYLVPSGITVLVMVILFSGTGDTRNRATIYVLLLPVLGYLMYRYSGSDDAQKLLAKKAMIVTGSLYLIGAFAFSITELIATLGN